MAVLAKVFEMSDQSFSDSFEFAFGLLKFSLKECLSSRCGTRKTTFIYFSDVLHLNQDDVDFGKSTASTHICKHMPPTSGGVVQRHDEFVHRIQFFMLVTKRSARLVLRGRAIFYLQVL